MPILIQNGRVVTATDDECLDIYCADDTITRIEPVIDPASLPNDTDVIDATDHLVFPGFIDPHVHIHLPFMGTHARDDYGSASRAALAGGTTTMIEMVCPSRDDDPLDAFHDWNARAASLAAVDYSFHIGVVRFDEAARRSLERLAREEGMTSFKVFLAYKGALDLPDEHLFELLTMARSLGVVVAAHCENADVVEAMQRRLLDMGRTGPEWHEPSRPTIVEASGVTLLSMLAEVTGATVYCVHTSCAEALEAAERAQRRGVDVRVEVVAPHLVLDASLAEQPDGEGAKFVMSPPLRAAHHQEALWSGIRRRSILTIGTDHAPFDTMQKAMGRDDFTKIPNGVPSLQERNRLVYTHGVTTGRIDLHTFVDACSTAAARCFGLYPRKGTIRIGSDADLVVFDPSHEGTLSVTTSASNVDYNAFEGWPVRGRVRTATVRGEVQVRDGRFVGTEGRGVLLRRHHRADERA